MEVNSSGAELPAAMNEAPATSSAKCSFWKRNEKLIFINTVYYYSLEHSHAYFGIIH